MRHQGIKNLIFDFGGVLIDLDINRCLDSFRQLGVQHVEKLLDIYHQEDFFHQYEMGQISSAEFRDVIRSKSNQSLTDEQIDGAWNSFLIGVPAYKLEALLNLRQHYMVYLLSNTNEIHWQWSCQNTFPYKGFRVEDYFEQQYLSFEMGMAKPDAAIYRRVIDEAGIDPSETLFLDDSLLNLQGAEAFGIRTHLTQPQEDWRHLFT